MANICSIGFRSICLLPAFAFFFLLTPGSMGGVGDPIPVKKTLLAKDGLRLVCEVRGNGNTALVFLHGWCGDREYWKNQVEVFAAEYRVVTLDQAGHGQSGKDRQNWSISGLAEDVEFVAEALGLNRMILVGHSMGGAVAVLAAKRMPGKVIAVIGAETLQNAELDTPDEVKEQFLDGFAADFKGTMRTALNGLVSDKTKPEVRSWLMTRAMAQDEKMAVALMRDIFNLDLKELLQEAKVPIRCINSGGGYGFFTPTDIEINKKYADYDALFINDVGHYPMLEKPEEFNQKLRVVLQGF